MQELAWSTPWSQALQEPGASSGTCCAPFLCLPCWKSTCRAELSRGDQAEQEVRPGTGRLGGWGPVGSGGASCFLPPPSSHSCPFVLQVFRRADKNGECGFPWDSVVSGRPSGRPRGELGKWGRI